MKMTWQMWLATILLVGVFAMMADAFVDSFKRHTVEYVPAAEPVRRIAEASQFQDVSLRLLPGDIPDPMLAEHLIKEDYTIYCGTHQQIINEINEFQARLLVAGRTWSEDGYIQVFVDAQMSLVVYLILPNDKACMLEASLVPVWSLENFDKIEPLGEKL